jgi:hypothetical protein
MYGNQTDQGARDYRRALKEIEGLMRARRNTPQGDRLDLLVTLVGGRANGPAEVAGRMAGPARPPITLNR